MAVRLRVMIADDQRLLCEGFRELIELEPDLEVVGMAGDGEEALAQVERLHAEHMAPAVVLSVRKKCLEEGVSSRKEILVYDRTTINLSRFPSSLERVSDYADQGHCPAVSGSVGTQSSPEAALDWRNCRAYDRRSRSLVLS